MSTQPQDERLDMRWDGWGDPARAHGLPGGVKLLLGAVLGRVPKAPPGPDLADVRISTPPLPDPDLAALAGVVGAEHVRTGHDVRLLHAGGKSTPDLLRRRQTEQAAPGAVVLPGTDDEVAAVLAVAGERGLAVVPFGGGTAVTGGLEPDAGPHRGVVSLDLRRLSGLIAFDDVDQEATFGAGTTAPAAEAVLGERGFELGHFPQSFEFATLGGFAALRSSGQSSAGHGRFDAMVTGLRVVTPTGTLDLGRAPGSAAGPDLVRWFLGSEGTFGVITRVRVRVHPVPEARLFDAWTFGGFAAGADGLRRVAQLGTGPTVIRLSDEAETAVSLAQVGSIGRALTKGCSAVVVHEGPADLAAARRAATSRVLQEAGGVPAAPRLAAAWDHGRFKAPYLRDALLAHGVFCETLETATTWSNLRALKASVTSALTQGFDGADARHRILCHVSHVYPTGASLYFTVIAGLGPEPLDAWLRIKARTNDAIMAAGGMITHHHGVGTDHAPWLEQEIGPAGVRMLRAVRAELDPAGIMNPGALLAPARVR
ncbi:FAD-binding oxidoreductase [Promicromonospora thailandica]|uniref:Alkyldihydroxyacetonephosphate synthase n=1 Tax=Promicromonospora thailandica TaxID=765201 RepID=A0A9X2FZI1_9MICO|nr:FAD-binding oxidoreductase [Promicromonospora thailandica]MCP2264250.1 alkyldihydroxyacetonephosphate synthase [Promicromonospora thailandica]BFF21071.1 FAD-binding oxidoreductase [Promicromonospora thailandica]